MAILLELHFSKSDILQGYINEIYLGQDGPRAIHGFGLASQYYFKKPLADLSLSQQALLVALVRGASYYNPWRNPQRGVKAPGPGPGYCSARGASGCGCGGIGQSTTIRNRRALGQQQ